ncbi:MAG: hypothetical protein U0575_02450 [Phycisphaerales bacterium]
MSSALDFLFRLLATPTPSGFEQEGQRLWLDHVRPVADRVWNDAYGNCFAELNPTGVPSFGAASGASASNGPSRPATVAICGHMDEIGLMVCHIDEKGFVYCKAIGGIDTSSIVGKRVRFRSSAPPSASAPGATARRSADGEGGDGSVWGVIGATAIHLQDKSTEAKVRKLHELFVDIGANDRAGAEAMLRIGDPGVFADGPMRLGEHLLVARGLDNRVGTWVAAQTLRQLAERRDELRCRVVAVSTVQEEVGLVGASMIAEQLKPDIALVTDVGHATDSPGISHAQHGQIRLGGGPRLAVGSAMQRHIVARLEAIAATAGIPLQRAAIPGKSGTDTDAIVIRNGGIPSGLVSLPIRYMHTTVEMTSLIDLQRIADLFSAFCRSLSEGERFTLDL